MGLLVAVGHKEIAGMPTEQQAVVVVADRTGFAAGVSLVQPA